MRNASGWLLVVIATAATPFVVQQAGLAAQECEEACWNGETGQICGPFEEPQTRHTRSRTATW
jgi:hypothetical protein